jgi:polysaccharide export outer membrane protein
MYERQRGGAVRASVLLWLGCVVCGGCGPLQDPAVRPDAEVPRELRRVFLPPYVIEPPDILLIDAIRVVPKPPYHIETLDALLIQAEGLLMGAELVPGIYAVDPDGTINLGVNYGTVKVVGLTLKGAEEAILAQLKKRSKDAKVSVALAQSRSRQRIIGQHIVRPDGTVSLGTYGSAFVGGMTVEQAKYAIEQHLSNYLDQPEISLDVYSYNSKYYYIIMDGGGYGQQIIRLPVTGRDTVLDALSQISGLPSVASTRHIWVARPNGGDPCQEQILPVDWQSLTRCGNPATNYQLMPNDRIFVQADALIHANNALTKLFNPLERIFGFTLLGTSTVQSIKSTELLFSTGNTGQGAVIVGPGTGR